MSEKSEVTILKLCRYDYTGKITKGRVGTTSQTCAGTRESKEIKYKLNGAVSFDAAP